MSLIQEVRNYYGLFGPYGAWLAGRSLLFNTGFDASIEVPGFRSPVHVRLVSSDVLALRQVLLNSEYAWDLPFEPRVIVDAGANIGITSVFFANRYPKARIIAIEPESRNYEMLKKNAGPYPNVIPVQAALWRENGSIEVLDPGEGNWGFRTQKSVGPTDQPTCGAVRAVTLDSLMAELGLERVDLLKVDIEGAEREVFASPEAWMQSVGAILIELHDRYKIGCSRSVYRATQDFECEDRRGEVILLSRAKAPSDQSNVPGRVPANGVIPGAVRLPLRVIDASRERQNGGKAQPTG